MTDKKNATEVKAPTIKWDDTNMRTTYSNAVNAFSTKEEFAILFGTNKTWKDNDGEFKVDLSDRMILNPHAALRLHSLLGAVLKEYENRFGSLTSRPTEAKQSAS